MYCNLFLFKLCALKGERLMFIINWIFLYTVCTILFSCKLALFAQLLPECGKKKIWLLGLYSMSALGIKQINSVHQVVLLEKVQTYQKSSKQQKTANFFMFQPKSCGDFSQQLAVLGGKLMYLLYCFILFKI